MKGLHMSGLQGVNVGCARGVAAVVMEELVTGSTAQLLLMRRDGHEWQCLAMDSTAMSSWDFFRDRCFLSAVEAAWMHFSAKRLER